MERLLNWFKKRVNFLSLLVLSIAVPLYPKFPLQAVEGTWVAIRVDDLLVAFAFFFWFLSQWLRGFPFLKERIVKLFLIYWLVGVIANLGAIFIGGLISPKLAIFHFLRRIEYMSLFLIAFDAILSIRNSFLWKKELFFCFIAIFLTSLGVFAYGIGQKYFGLPVVSTMNREFSKGMLLYLDKWTRISSTFAGHYDLAVWLVMILSFLISLFFWVKFRWQKILVFVVFWLNFYLLIMTASRVSFISYLIGITVTLVILKKWRWWLVIVGLSLFFGFKSKELNARLAVSLKFLSPLSARISAPVKKLVSLKLSKLERNLATTPAPTIILEEPKEKETILVEKTKIEEVVKIDRTVRTWPNPEEAQAAAIRSSAIRFEVEWPRALRAFYKNPLIGSGFSSLGLATDNDYLRILGETGILGLFSFGLVIFHILAVFLKGILEKKEEGVILAGLFGGLIGFMANGVFIDVFEASKVAFYFWMMAGLGYGIIFKFKSN